MATQYPRPDEQELKQRAKSVEAPTPDELLQGIKKGKPLPEGFKNPPCGNPQHRCLDSKGHYVPDWSQLLLRKPQGCNADKEFFSLTGHGQMRVPYDKWVDVPPWLVVVLGDAIETHYKRNVDDAGNLELNGREGPGVVEEVKVPAFSYSLLRSA